MEPVATSPHPLTAIGSQLASGLLENVLGGSSGPAFATGGTLHGAPIAVTVNARGDQEVDSGGPLSKQDQTFDMIKTVLWVLGGFLVARQFRPRKK